MNEGLQVQWTPRLAEFVEKMGPEASEFTTQLQTLGVWNSTSEGIEEQEKGVSYRLVKEMYEWEKKEVGKSRLYLHELLKGSAFFLQPPPVVEKDPAFVARLEKMRHQVENRLYGKMVENVSNDRLKRVEEENRADMKTGMDTVKLAGNLAMSVVAVFAATYFIFHNAYHDTILSISASTIAAIGIFMVEVILVVLRGAQLDNVVAKSRDEFNLGISSPFPPAAPSIIEAERQKAEDSRKLRIASRKQAKLALTGSIEQNTSNAIEFNPDDHDVAPLITSEADANINTKLAKFSNLNELVSTSKTSGVEESASKNRVRREVLVEVPMGGPVLDD